MWLRSPRFGAPARPWPLPSRSQNRTPLSGAGLLSRWQSSVRVASAGPAPVGWSLSTAFRQRPSKTGWVCHSDSAAVMGSGQTGDRLRLASRCQLPLWGGTIGLGCRRRSPGSAGVLGSRVGNGLQDLDGAGAVVRQRVGGLLARPLAVVSSSSPSRPADQSASAAVALARGVRQNMPPPSRY